MATEDEKGIPQDARDWKAPGSKDKDQRSEFNLAGFSHTGDHEVIPTTIRKEQLADDIRTLESDVERLTRLIESSRSRREELQEEGSEQSFVAGEGRVQKLIQDSMDRDRKLNDQLTEARNQLNAKRDQLKQMGS